MSTYLHEMPVIHIAVCGGGLAGYMTAAALSRHLPATYRITFIVTDETPSTDIFYGSVTAPSAYDFNLSVGVSEPALVLESNSAFSLGTHYQAWGEDGRSWVQGFQLPLPILNGVQFHQYLTRQGIDTLEPYLVSAAAAKRGVFAHPPEQAANPLSRSEYGYQLDASAYSRLFALGIAPSRICIIRAGITEIQASTEGIGALHLSDGQRVSADMFIDCTGPEGLLLGRLGARPAGRRGLGAAMSLTPGETLGPAVRTLTGRPFGWQSITPLQGATAKLTVFSEEDECLALTAHGDDVDARANAAPGRQAQAWIGNCVAIGQAAAVVEPLTPAPIMLLQGDIERLISLIPLSRDMAMERREFNRRFADDHEYAELFQRALFATAPVAPSGYWKAAQGAAEDTKLVRKLTQFLSRGSLVSYDLEPFTPEDWTILHYGMGRRPRRSDRLADQAPEAQVKQYLSDLQRDIVASTGGLPSHHSYMSGLKRFLLQKSS
ncbi:tryptophan 7-halogenase [Asticcacaulis sp.]|uniref:tryptophan 7-halogenase n=1 Tax=Asticcacaulis sp. TaxID=1872648 RepID=UPI002C52C0DB|nr:tryptophan 7-halogenase [Asticcacaulis sp.]HTM82288.1 tryptophan 7-halogenase [Asticcacaulis sp.]